VHPEDLQTTKANWKKSLTSGEPFQQENRFKQKDGTYRLHLNRAHALRDNEGQIVMWIGSSTDIEDVTQAVVRKDQLELLTAGLKEQRKQLLALNNAKDEFIALASHQLRTPATAVKQYISLMLEGYASPVTSTQKAYLQTEIDSSGYTLRRESYNVANLLNEIIAELQPNLRYKQQSAIFKDESDQTAILIDVNEMKIALSNLLENASKYSHNDSTIHIKLLRKNGKLLIEIKDEGVGLKQGDTRRIFDKFTRVNNELSDTVSGTGLGLYWVKQIIKLHGGSVNVRSILGKGSTFIVSLPI
jgi:two-component system, OmpR family, phosphate regulon sensor histidine kinase PhoR